jgi:hypothetical protein
MDMPPIKNRTEKEVPPAWDEEARRCLKETMAVLGELEAAGFSSNRIVKVVLTNKTDCPLWIPLQGAEGYIKINPRYNDARAIAHEAGHALHERWRRTDSGRVGQSMAEAIRYFVEERMGRGAWKPQPQWMLVLDRCQGSFARFKKLLEGEELHRLSQEGG